MELANNKPIIALSALATHSVLHHGEWDNSLHIIFGAWILGFGGLLATTYNSQTHSIGAALKVTMNTAALYFSILIASILLHRGFLHRLRNVRDIVSILYLTHPNASRSPVLS
jgi:hypothetical protein